jgi:2-dehydropantoate 2-reductase
MGTRVAVVGTGAIGGYTCGQMARAGEDVTMIDMWPEHVDYMRKHGLQLSGMSPAETVSVPVNALHVSDVQGLAKQRPIDVAFISVKSYDTQWATALIKPYLAPGGFVVSLQNCINEEQIAEVAGWGKTLGAIVSLLGAELYAPGHIKRTVKLSDYVIYRVGETHGGVTARAEEAARLLGHAAGSKVTTNLWGERWSKLIINSMGNGVTSVAGLGGADRDLNEVARWVRIRLASETVRIGKALGYTLEVTQNMDPEMLARAGEGGEHELAEITKILLANAKTRAEENRPSMAQDISKGRRTETDYINGYVATKGEEIGVHAPINAKMNELVKRLERGELKPSVDNLNGI